MPATPAGRYIFGQIPWYSALIALGIVFALWWACREEKRLSLPRDTMVDLALRLIPLGIIGARLYYVIFAWDTFRDNPVTALYIWQGGLAIYGGVIGGVIGAVWYCRRKRVPLLRVLDAIAPDEDPLYPDPARDILEADASTFGTSAASDEKGPASRIPMIPISVQDPGDTFLS